MAGFNLPPGCTVYDIERAQMPGCFGSCGDHGECERCDVWHECKREAERDGPDE